MTPSRFEVDLRLIAAAAAALVAGLTVLSLTRPAPAIEVIVAGDHLPPGVALGMLPLETASLRDAPGALSAADLEASSHLALTAGLAPGDPVLVSLLADPQAGNVIGLTLRPEQAVHGALVPGDRVAVYALREDLPPRRVAASVLVLSVADGSGGLGASDVALLLAVDDRLAADLIRSVHESTVHLVRLGR